jgi:hypothetical protein
MYLRAVGIDFASFYDSLLDFRTVPKALYFLFLNLIFNIDKISKSLIFIQ